MNEKSETEIGLAQREAAATALEEAASALYIPEHEETYRSIWRLGRKVTRTVPETARLAHPKWLYDRSLAVRYGRSYK